MALVVFDLSLYTKDHINDWDKCEWRQYLNSLPNIQYKDLGYYGANLEDTVAPINTWLDADEELFTPESFPFVIYQLLDTTNTAGYRLVYHRTLESLKNDEVLKNYAP